MNCQPGKTDEKPTFTELAFPFQAVSLFVGCDSLGHAARPIQKKEMQSQFYGDRVSLMKSRLAVTDKKIEEMKLARESAQKTSRQAYRQTKAAGKAVFLKFELGG